MVLIIPSFVVTGIYSYSRMSTDDNAIARVGEVPILPEQFDMAQRQQLQNLQQQLGEAFRPNMLDNAEARAAILQSMMDDSAVAQTVAKEWVTVSEAEAIALVKNADALKENGQFSPELYENFLRSQGKSDEQFVYELRQDLAKNTLISGVSATHPAPKALAQDLHDILAEERQVRTMIFNVGDYYDEAKAPTKRSPPTTSRTKTTSTRPNTSRSSTSFSRPKTSRRTSSPTKRKSRSSTNRTRTAGRFRKNAARATFFLSSATTRPRPSRRPKRFSPKPRPIPRSSANSPRPTPSTRVPPTTGATSPTSAAASW